MDRKPFLGLINDGRYTSRTPRPANPILRPAYQGSNPVADIFSLWALRTTVEHLPRIAKNPDDSEARRQMLCVVYLRFHDSSKRYFRLAASFAGIGFGNAGVHLCHGMSYPVRLFKKFLNSLCITLSLGYIRFRDSTRKARNTNTLDILSICPLSPTVSGRYLCLYSAIHAHEGHSVALTGPAGNFLGSCFAILSMLLICLSLPNQYSNSPPPRHLTATAKPWRFSTPRLYPIHL